MDIVSVIIPMYNSEKYIYQCLKSVLDQTYKYLEVIVVDDCSTDRSVDIVNSFNDNRIKLVKNKKNEGVSFSRNKGVKLSTGIFLCFLDSDDFWDKNKIKMQLDFIKKNDYSFIYGSYIIYGKRSVKVNVPKSLTYKQALKNTTIFTSTVMFNMNHIKKSDLFMENISIGQDTLCWWSILKKDIVAYGINDYLATYRVGNVSLSSNKIVAIKGAWNIYKMQGLGLLKTLLYFSCYLFNAVRRRI